MDLGSRAPLRQATIERLSGHPDQQVVIPVKWDHSWAVMFFHGDEAPPRFVLAACAEVIILHCLMRRSLYVANRSAPLDDFQAIWERFRFVVACFAVGLPFSCPPYHAQGPLYAGAISMAAWALRGARWRSVGDRRRAAGHVVLDAIVARSCAGGAG